MDSFVTTHDRSSGSWPPDDQKCFATPAPPEDRLLGTVVGDRYKILSLIGSGGMGAVYKARHISLGKIQAIKVVRQSSLCSDTAVNRFGIEAKAAGSLTHPNLVAVHDYGLTGFGEPYLVMDYVEGVNLLDVLKRDGCLNSSLVIELFEQLCDGLNYAHSQGVVHRDIKPSNIILTRTANGAPQIKIVDFGIAKLLDPEVPELTQTGELFGSPLYMSPEQCRGQREIDARSDIYSLACVMYEALTGEPPFLGSNAIQTMYMQINEAPRGVQGASKRLNIPGALENVVMRALEKKPSERYQSMDAFRQDLLLIRGGGKPARSKNQLWFNKQPVRKRLVIYSVAAFLGIWMAVTAACCSVFAPIIFMPEWQRTLNKANNHLRRGQYDEAEQFYLRALELVDQSHESANIRALVRSNFADFDLIMADTQEDNDRNLKALNLYEQAEGLVTAENKGQPSVEQSACVGREGECYFRLKKYSKAIESFRQAIAISEISAKNGSDSSGLLYKIGRAYSAQGKQPEAELNYRHAIAAASKAHDEPNVEISNYYHYLANSLVDQKKFDAADKSYDQSEQIRRRISGDSNPVYLSTVLDHAKLLEKTNRPERAKALQDYVKHHRLNNEETQPL